MGGCTHCQERSCELKRPSVPETQEDKNNPTYMGEVRGKTPCVETNCQEQIGRQVEQ